MRKFNLRFPVNLLTRIKKQAAREGMNSSTLVRTVLKRYLDEQDSKSKTKA